MEIVKQLPIIKGIIATYQLGKRLDELKTQLSKNTMLTQFELDRELQ